MHNKPGITLLYITVAFIINRNVHSEIQTRVWHRHATTELLQLMCLRQLWQKFWQPLGGFRSQYLISLDWTGQGLQLSSVQLILD